MNWNTIYIKGKLGFEPEVTNKLIGSGVSIMPGSLAEGENTALYWIEENTTLREIKKAIGSKIVFKYRLQFFKNLEEVNALEDKAKENFTPAEKDLIQRMTTWRSENVRYRNSA
jgi:hypothetical protein